MSNKKDILNELLNDMAEKSNTIDLNAYALGLKHMQIALKNMEPSSRVMSAERTYSENDMRKCWQACVESFNDCYAPNLEQFLSEYAT